MQQPNQTDLTGMHNALRRERVPGSIDRDYEDLVAAGRCFVRFHAEGNDARHSRIFSISSSKTKDDEQRRAWQSRATKAKVRPREHAKGVAVLLM